jgi:hypothetical protein
MQDQTISKTIEVVYPDGRRMTAWLGQTDVDAIGTPFQSTVDPEWHGQEAGKAEETGEWLPYRDWNGTYAKSKAHCKGEVAPPGPGAGPYIRTWFEHIDIASGNDVTTDDSEKYLLFQDWDGKVWKANVQNLTSYPGYPHFYLERQ